MKRVRRWFFSGLMVLPLLLCFATIAAWVLSYAIPVQVDGWKLIDSQHRPLEHQEAHFYGIDSTRGVFGISFTDEKGEMIPFIGWRFDVSHSRDGGVYHDPATTLFTRLGFHSWGQSWGGGNFQEYAITIHYWFLLAASGIVSLSALFRRWHRRAKQRAGLCLSCGYDLRATPDRCPECGTNVQKVA